jgi:hypothetical protein
MMVLNLGLCLIHMNQNQTFKILSTRSLDGEYLSLVGPKVLTIGKESPTFKTMVSPFLESESSLLHYFS